MNSLLSRDEASPSALAIFVADRLAARDENRLWLSLSLCLGFIASAAFLVVAFRHTGSIQDDGRMFLSWMGRWDDPSLLRNDLMADFWQSVSPWFFSATYRAAWLLGVEPLVFTKLLPALLYPLIALFSHRFLRAIGAEPLVAFVTTAIVLHSLVREDVVISATPRCFWPLLLLVGLDGLARVKVLQTATAQLLMTGTYPQLALVFASVIGLTLLTPWRMPYLDLSRRRLVLIAGAAVATIIGLLPFFLSSGQFSPTIRLDEALLTPTFSAGGRGTITTANGTLDFLCAPRLGIFDGKCRQPLEPDILLMVAAWFIGPTILLLRMFGTGTRRMRSELPFYVLAMSLAWFVLAALVLFKLHLPNRYTKGLIVLGLLTTPAVVVDWIRDRPFPKWLLDRQAGRALMLGGTAASFCLAVVGVTEVNSTFRVPKNPGLIPAIASLPKDDVVGGFVRDLDFSPVLTQRSTLFSRELAIAYQLGYFRPIIERMEGVRDAVTTRDPAVLSARLSSLDIDRLLVNRTDLASGRVPTDYRGFFGPELETFERNAAASNEPPLIAKLATACTQGIYGEVVMLDAGCLQAKARSS